MYELFDDIATSEDNENHDDELKQMAIKQFGKRRAEQMTPEEIIAELGNR